MYVLNSLSIDNILVREKSTVYRFPRPVQKNTPNQK